MFFREVSSWYLTSGLGLGFGILGTDHRGLLKHSGNGPAEHGFVPSCSRRLLHCHTQSVLDVHLCFLGAE